jgi:hypothetical protein
MRKGFCLTNALLGKSRTRFWVNSPTPELIIIYESFRIFVGIKPKFIKDQVASGIYSSASEVVREALRLFAD